MNITSAIIETIKTKAEAIDEIQQVFMHPEGADMIEVVDDKVVYKGTRVTEYPALIFMKDTFSSDFADSGSNHRTINFKAWVLVPCENKESTDIWERILPNAVDAVLEKFDVGYDFGTIDGHRVWCRMDSGLQGYTPEPSGRVAWEELTLVVRLDVNI
jgi:hypothetical protein